METTTATKSTITTFERANSQLRNTVFQHSTNITYTFLPAMNRSLHASLVKFAPPEVTVTVATAETITHCLNVLTSTVGSP